MGSTHRARIVFKDEDRPETNYAEMFAVKLEFARDNRAFRMLLNLPSLTEDEMTKCRRHRRGGGREGNGKERFFGERRASPCAFIAALRLFQRRASGDNGTRGEAAGREKEREREGPKSNGGASCSSRDEAFTRTTPECARFPYRAAANRTLSLRKHVIPRTRATQPGKHIELSRERERERGGGRRSPSPLLRSFEHGGAGSPGFAVAANPKSQT